VPDAQVKGGIFIGTNQEKIKEENVFYRRIGSTTYKVRLHFKENGETMEDKILHLLQMETSQISCQPKEVSKCS